MAYLSDYRLSVRGSVAAVSLTHFFAQTLETQF
jgi:hypothetical protein